MIKGFVVYATLNNDEQEIHYGTSLTELEVLRKLTERPSASKEEFLVSEYDDKGNHVIGREWNLAEIRAHLGLPPLPEEDDGDGFDWSDFAD